MDLILAETTLAGSSFFLLSSGAAAETTRTAAVTIIRTVAATALQCADLSPDQKSLRSYSSQAFFYESESINCILC